VKPYYEADGITIYHGDCREIAPSIGTFDLLLTDPPYGLGEAVWGRNKPTPNQRWRSGGPGTEWDADRAEVLWLLPFAREAIVWGGHLMDLPTMRGWLVWNKVIRNWSSGTSELAWTNLDIPIDTFDYSHGQLAHEGKAHPTQKPVPLMKWCILKANDAQLILDPFAGSGSTLRAAKDLGRKAIGIEIVEKYAEVAAKRLAQGVLFEAPEPAKPAEQMALDVSPLTPPPLANTGGFVIDLAARRKA
jgi:DNA modification methylase